MCRELVEKLLSAENMPEEFKEDLASLLQQAEKADAYDELYDTAKRLETAYKTLSQTYGIVYGNLIYEETKVK